MTLGLRVDWLERETNSLRGWEMAMASHVNYRSTMDHVVLKSLLAKKLDPIISGAPFLGRRRLPNIPLVVASGNSLKTQGWPSM